MGEIAVAITEIYIFCRTSYSEFRDTPPSSLFTVFDKKGLLCKKAPSLASPNFHSYVTSKPYSMRFLRDKYPSSILLKSWSRDYSYKMWPQNELFPKSLVRTFAPALLSAFNHLPSDLHKAGCLPIWDSSQTSLLWRSPSRLPMLKCPPFPVRYSVLFYP